MNKKEIRETIVELFEKCGLDDPKVQEEYNLDIPRLHKFFENWAIAMQNCGGDSVNLQQEIEQAIELYARTLVEVPK